MTRDGIECIPITPGGGVPRLNSLRADMTREETLAAEDIAARLAGVVPDGAHAEVRLYGAEGKRIARVKIDRRPPGRGEPVVEVGDVPAEDGGGTESGVPADLRPRESMLEYVKRKERESFAGEAEPKITDKAGAFLREGRNILLNRAKEYDRPDGERSAIAAAKMWNALTGKNMTESEAWQFLACLKHVRLATSPGPHDDSATDAAVYSALAGEAKHREEFERVAFGVNPVWGKKTETRSCPNPGHTVTQTFTASPDGWSAGAVASSDDVEVKTPRDDTTNRKPGPREAVSPARLVGMLRELASGVSAFLTSIEEFERHTNAMNPPTKWKEFGYLRAMVKSSREACERWAEIEPVSGGGVLNFLRRFGGAEKVVQALDNLVRVVDAMPGDRSGCITDAMEYGEAKNIAVSWRNFHKTAGESKAAHDPFPVADAVAIRQGRADKLFVFRVCDNGSVCPDWSNPLVGSIVSAAEWEKLTGRLSPDSNSMGGNGSVGNLWWTYTPREKKPNIDIGVRVKQGVVSAPLRRSGFFVNNYPVTRDAYERLTGSPLMPGVAWAEYDGPTVYDTDPKRLVDDITGPKDSLRGLGIEFLVNMVGGRLASIPVDSRNKVVKMMKDIIDTDRKRHEQAPPRTEGAGA